MLAATLSPRKSHSSGARVLRVVNFRAAEGPPPRPHMDQGGHTTAARLVRFADRRPHRGVTGSGSAAALPHGCPPAHFLGISGVGMAHNPKSPAQK
jgi:hypothetical protein